ncbi:MAG TPA: 6-carboxytetrahydropterin synthase [Terriglobia bacterium]|nr:6-carboxytetrahydropterin synthase [Terriglobia bacterium]
MIAFLTRRYRFSASHRLHNAALSASENARLYGKCNSPFGHGHNYALEVTVAGPIDPASGMVYDLVALDGAVERKVLEPFDTSYLNLDVDAFQNQVPTTENVCIEIFNRLRDQIGQTGQMADGALPARLARVRLEETSSNFFEYEGV